MFDLEAAKAENLKAQKALDDMGDLLALIVDVSDNKVPQLRNDINEIVKNIKDGFDKEELAKQIRTVLNQVINQSDYSKLQANIDTATKKMIDAVETSSRQVDQWQDSYQSRSRWHFALISGALFFCIGFAACYWWNKPTVSQQQETAADIGTIAKYVRDSVNTQIIQNTTSNPKPKAAKKKPKPQTNSDDEDSGYNQ